MLPEALEAPYAAFSGQVERVAVARRALLSCLPVGRTVRAPVPIGLDLLADELAVVQEELPAWEVPEAMPAWRACADAVSAALDAVPHAREVALRSSELEEVLHAVTAVVEPLEAWADAERAWGRLHARRSPR